MYKVTVVTEGKEYPLLNQVLLAGESNAERICRQLSGVS